MKIVFITIGGEGGADLSLLPVLNALKEHHDLMVINTIHNKFSTKLNLNGFRNQYIPIPPYVYPDFSNLMNLIRFPDRLLRNLFKIVKGEQNLKKFICNYRPDIIYTNTGIIHSGFNISKRINIPHIWHIREFQDLDFNMKILGGKKNLISKFHSTNNFNIAITQTIYDHFSLNDKNSTIIYDGVRARTVFSLNKKQKYFLYIGNITPNKGFSFLLEAFNLFNKTNKDFRLIVLGRFNNSSYQNKIKEYIEKNSLNDFIIFKGFLINVEPYIREAKAVIMPSFFEALGRTTIESMFYSTLVIGRNTAGTKEQFDNGVKYSGDEIGLRFSAIDDLVKCMQNAIKNDYYENIRRANETVNALYSFETFYNRINSIIERYERTSNIS